MKKSILVIGLFVSVFTCLVAAPQVINFEQRFLGVFSVNASDVVKQKIIIEITQKDFEVLRQTRKLLKRLDANLDELIRDESFVEQLFKNMDTILSLLSIIEVENLVVDQVADDELCYLSKIREMCLNLQPIYYEIKQLRVCIK